MIQQAHDAHDAEWQDKVAIVTDAVSGTGLATTRLLHTRGATVIAVSKGDDVFDPERPTVAALAALGHAAAVPCGGARRTGTAIVFSPIGARGDRTVGNR